MALLGGEHDEPVELGFKHRQGAVDGVEIGRAEFDGDEVLIHQMSPGCEWKAAAMTSG